MGSSASSLQSKDLSTASPQSRVYGSRNINSRTIAAPLAAFTMASILFVYARTSIRAAKLNAQAHREADGGQISWHNENLRRHGRMRAPDEDKSVVTELKDALVGGKELKKKPGEEGSKSHGLTRVTDSEEELRKKIAEK